MATAKNRWLADAIGTGRDYFRVGLAGARLKNVAGVLQLRTANDGADANMKAAAIQLSTGAGLDKVLQSDALGNGSWVDPLTAAAETLQSSLFCVSPQFRTLVGGGFAYPTHDAGGSLAWYGDMSGLNAEAELTFAIAAGVYQPQSFHALAPSGGIVTIKIDGVSLSATIDSYQAGINSAAQAIFSNVTLAAGQHVLNMKITGKNASSSAWHYWLSAFVLRLT